MVGAAGADPVGSGGGHLHLLPAAIPVIVVPVVRGTRQIGEPVPGRREVAGEVIHLEREGEASGRDLPIGLSQRAFPLAERKQIRVTSRVPEDLSITADRELLDQELEIVILADPVWRGPGAIAGDGDLQLLDVHGAGEAAERVAVRVNARREPLHRRQRRVRRRGQGQQQDEHDDGEQPEAS